MAGGGGATHIEMVRSPIRHGIDVRLSHRIRIIDAVWTAMLARAKAAAFYHA